MIIKGALIDLSDCWQMWPRGWPISVQSLAAFLHPSDRFRGGSAEHNLWSATIDVDPDSAVNDPNRKNNKVTLNVR